MHGLLFKNQYGHHDLPPTSQVNHKLHQLPWNWAFSHSWTTIAKCGGAPYCMKINSLILSQAMIISQTSSFSIVWYLSTFMVSWRVKGPTILSEVIPHIPLPWVYSAFFTGNTRIFSRPVVAVTNYKIMNYSSNKRETSCSYTYKLQSVNMPISFWSTERNFLATFLHIFCTEYKWLRS